MPIRIECPTCRSSFSVQEDLAGKRGKCSKCQTPLTIPAAPSPPVRPAADDDGEEGGVYELAGSGPKARAVPVRGPTSGKTSVAVALAAAPSRPTRTPAEILRAFGEAIEPVRPTPLYRLWIVIVAGTMVLLPLIYLAIIGLVGVGLVYYAVHGVAIFEHVGANRATFLLYVGPLIAGAVVFAFMLKPLFARPVKRAKARALDPSNEPLLFAFVDGICAAVGAPTPSRIEVDCEVNAGAYLAGGPLALWDNTLVLRIGLPLAAGLSLKQFAGVLAHEFGHFSQSAGMRLTYLIGSINGWFARVVFERDRWDETLIAWSKGGNIYAMGLAWVARGAVWLTRKVLWVLMLAAHLVAGFLSRQKEFDADRYEARMVGGAVFASTTERLAELGLASQGAYADLASSWREHRLPDDLPKLILANVVQIPREVRDAFHEQRMGRRTGPFDTHPADADRVARARAEADEGIFQLVGHATDLFPFFDSLCKVATFEHYRALLGRQITKDQLYPVADAIEGQAAAQQGNEAFERYFLGGLSVVRPFPLAPEYPSEPLDPKAARKMLVDARSDLQVLREKTIAAHERWEELHRQAVGAEAAIALLKAGNRINGADFGLRNGTLGAAEESLRQAEAALGALSASSGPFEETMARRLTLALSFLESGTVAAKVSEGPARRDEARALYPCAAHLGGRIVGEVPTVIRSNQVVSYLIGRFQQGKDDKNQALINACLRASRGLRDRLAELQWKVGTTLHYPFEHAREDITLGQFALPNVPASDAVGDLAQVGDATVEKLLTLHRRVLGRLAVTAEEVERALGMPPLVIPEATPPPS